MMCSSGDPHYHTCCEEHDQHDHGPPDCSNMSCYCYPPPARYRNGGGGSNGWQEGGKKKKKLGGIWDENELEEREKLKEFWLGLGDSQRQFLLRIEKESILREMREQQRHICSCSVCGRRRTVLEEELELLYDAYYSELEDRGDSGEIDIEMIDYHLDEVDLSLSLKAVDGGVLTVADDLLVDDGRKFFTLMEKLADGRAQNGYEQMGGSAEQYQGEYDEEGYQEEEEEEEDEELLEEQRIEEGRRMFQMFAAKMFEQRVLAAYREKVALEKQEQLMQEEEEEEKLQAERKENKARKERERKQKRKELKRQQELEKERKRLEKEQEEKVSREKELKEREEKRQERQRQKEEEKRKKEEEDKRRKEEEGRRKSLERARKEAPKAGSQVEEKESQSESKSSKKKAKKDKLASESAAGPQEAEAGRAEGWEIAQGKHKKKAVSQEQPKVVPELVLSRVTDDTLAALRTSGAAKHYEQSGSHQSTPLVIPPGFQQPFQAPPGSAPARHSPQKPVTPTSIRRMQNPTAGAMSAPLANGIHAPLERERNGGVRFVAPDSSRAGGTRGPWPVPGQLKPSGMQSAHPPANHLLTNINHPVNHPLTTNTSLSQQATYAGNGLVQHVLGPLSIDVDQELSSSMEHLLPGGLLSATGDTPRGVVGPSGFEEGFAQLNLHPSNGVSQRFHDANGHFRQPSGSESPESLGSPDSTWSFGRRPGSGSNSSGNLSRPPSGEISRPWAYFNGAEEHLRVPLGPIGKAARQDVRASWDGSQGMLHDLPSYEMVRSASHSGLPMPAGSSPPMGGPLNGHHLPPHLPKPACHAEMAFEARLERAISILRSALPRLDASGTLVQPLSLSAFWQSLLAIDGSLLNERITRSQIQGIWMELASQRIVRIGHTDPARPNEPFILAMLLPGVNVNRLGVCLLCNEQPASVQLRPCSHLTCVACTSQLAAQADFGELCCPFCAQIVHGSAALGPDGHFLPSEHPANEEHLRPKSAHKRPQMRAQGTPKRSSVNGHKEIDQEWPTLGAAVTRKMEARPVLTGASDRSRPTSSNGEASRKAGWGSVSKAGSSTTPAKAASAHGTESAAWPPLDAASKACRKAASSGR